MSDSIGIHETDVSLRKKISHDGFTGSRFDPMLDRSWRHRLSIGLPALAVVIVIVFVVVIAATTSILNWGTEEYARRERAYPIPDTSCEPNKTCEQKALQMQARESAAADWATKIALGQLVLSLGGLGGIGLTVVFAGLAWREAEKSAKAAKDALEHTEKTSERQLRPYVFFTQGDRAALEKLTYEGRADLLLKNYGQTPARNILLRKGTMTATRPIGDVVVTFDDGPDELIELAPGGSLPIYFSMSDITPEQFDAFTDESLPLTMLVRLQATYEVKPGETDSHEITFVLCEDATKHGSLPILGHDQRTKRS